MKKMNKSERYFLLPFLIGIALIFLMEFMFSSCVLTKKQKRRYLAENCVTSSETKTKDSTSTTTKTKLDTVYKSIPGPIQYLASPCAKLCDSLGNLKPFKQESSKNGIKQSLHSVGNVLVQECNVDSLLSVIETLEKTIEHFHSEATLQQVHENCVRTHLTEKDIFWIRVGKILSMAVAGYILLRIAKVYLKTSVPWLARLIP